MDDTIKETSKEQKQAKSPQTIALEGIFNKTKHGTMISVAPCCDGGLVGFISV